MPGRSKALSLCHGVAECQPTRLDDQGSAGRALPVALMSPRFCCPKEPHDPFATLWAAGPGRNGGDHDVRAQRIGARAGRHRVHPDAAHAHEEQAVDADLLPEQLGAVGRGVLGSGGGRGRPHVRHVIRHGVVGFVPHRGNDGNAASGYYEKNESG